MLLLSLNDDVLAEILSFILSPLDALRFAQTCRYAYDVAMPRRLSEVIIKNPRQLLSFCHFVLADPKYRPICMRTLALYSTSTFFSAMQHELAEMLQRARFLRSLAVLDLESLLCSDHLRKVLFSLPHLQHINFSNIGNWSLRLLAEMVSRPHHVRLGPFDPSSRSSLLGNVLKRFAESLEILQIWIPGGLIQGLDCGVVYSHVHTLKLNGSQDREPISLPRLAQIFPNLKRLVCSASYRFSAENGPIWDSLDEVDAQYPIDIPTRVRSLVARNYRNDNNRDILNMLWRTSPAMLTCMMYPDAVLEMVQAAPGWKLKCLYLKLIGFVYGQKALALASYDTTGICDVSEYAEDDIGGRLVRAACALRVFPLVALSLCTGIAVMQIDRVARHVTSVIPTLEYVKIDDSTWYRVVSRPGPDMLPSLVMLSEAETYALEQWMFTLGYS
ncbi:hypothetical protein BKA93DRAFT_746109 [Sparassis latifolia]